MEWDPWQFDDARAERMRNDDLCQVCGDPQSNLVYVLAPLHTTRSLVEMYGGAVCSLKCARLTAALCPHYTAESPTGIYLVPRHNRVDMIGDGTNNDDEYDLAGLTHTSCTPAALSDRAGRVVRRRAQRHQRRARSRWRTTRPVAVPDNSRSRLPIAHGTADDLVDLTGLYDVPDRVTWTTTELAIVGLGRTGVSYEIRELRRTPQRRCASGSTTPGTGRTGAHTSAAHADVVETQHVRYGTLPTSSRSRRAPRSP
ncbi:hypothetical protein [Kibdelosporangium phytohabitans]|uniref:Uncharacterized protein n=1 Tax=Kibdelosporangium phytohabitans TaxID=860235 RepID=A0A0N9I257_9PSEU|nr:hypothetical protein [Kibdelosporangium phytohabitans]ALG12675.1 hypothetical protein AOZ06_42675 [Kibdelosporangium phytohabitans]MBE1464331.1 hypothetical protein [Kibdelosporangium phytohabitans]